MLLLFFVVFVVFVSFVFKTAAGANPETEASRA